jgi:hypothetical protein
MTTTNLFSRKQEHLRTKFALRVTYDTSPVKEDKLPRFLLHLDKDKKTDITDQRMMLSVKEFKYGWRAFVVKTGVVLHGSTPGELDQVDLTDASVYPEKPKDSPGVNAKGAPATWSQIALIPVRIANDPNTECVLEVEDDAVFTAVRDLCIQYAANTKVMVEHNEPTVLDDSSFKPTFKLIKAQ